MRRLASLVSFSLILGAVAGACDDDEPEPAEELVLPPPPPPPPRPSIAAPVASNAPASFDLVLGPEGPLWIVGRPSRVGGGLEITALGPQGSARGEPRTVAASDEAIAPMAVEIAAAVAGEKLGVAWVEREQREARVRAALGDASTLAMGEPMVLSGLEVPLEHLGHRGHVAAVTDGSRIEVTHSRTDGPCAGQSGTCARVAQDALGSRQATRGDEWTFRQPCDQPVLGAVIAGGTRYHALCSVEGGGTQTAIFGRDGDGSRSQVAFERCAGKVLSFLGDAAVIAGDCDGEPQLWRTADGAETLERLDAPAVTCREETPVLRFGDREIPLAEPREALAPILPTHIAGADDRAVWTGEAVLVATTLGDEAVLRRYACERNTFQRTDL